ncbi:hypothetical protein AB0395_22155 [Streptosporangium sp. NPDC051023]|uniref:hypothetical protein n=1 Tax=Streptosporangium sp. NPDC051023 TaxID=3155410 RepID=UPI00344F49CE
MKAVLSLPEILDLLAKVYTDNDPLVRRVTAMQRMLRQKETITPITIDILNNVLGNAYDRSADQREDYHDRLVQVLGAERARRIATADIIDDRQAPPIDDEEEDYTRDNLPEDEVGKWVQVRIFQSLGVLAADEPDRSGQNA